MLVLLKITDNFKNVFERRRHFLKIITSIYNYLNLHQELQLK